MCCLTSFAELVKILWLIVIFRNDDHSVRLMDVHCYGAGAVGSTASTALAQWFDKWAFNDFPMKYIGIKGKYVIKKTNDSKGEQIENSTGQSVADDKNCETS